jgi:hypothetical protein
MTNKIKILREISTDEIGLLKTPEFKPGLENLETINHDADTAPRIICPDEEYHLSQPAQKIQSDPPKYRLALDGFGISEGITFDLIEHIDFVFI